MNQILGDAPGGLYHDRYEVERPLGKKSGRWTLLARDRTTKDLVVLKLLFIDDELTQNDLKLFKREADILKLLSHPATPQYLGHFEIDLPRDGKALALIQTYVKGKSLYQSIQEGQTFSEAEARQIAKAVLEILLYLHELHPPIIHRDIRPSNVLLADRPDDGDRVRLIDFGSVKSLAPSGNTTFTVVGTDDDYTPPEQMGGRAIKASDLYSLGATLITAIAGVHASDLPRQGLRINFEQSLDLSPAFASWLKHMAEPNLDKRFNSAQVALQALEQAL